MSDWGTVASVASSVMTAPLLVAAIWLAIETRAMARATAELVKQTQQQRADGVAPIVTIELAGPGPPSGRYPVVRLRNAGAGPALNLCIEVPVLIKPVFFSEDRKLPDCPTVFGVGYQVTAQLVGVPGLAGPGASSPLTLRVRYCDSYGRGYESWADSSVLHQPSGRIELSLGELHYQRPAG